MLDVITSVNLLISSESKRYRILIFKEIYTDIMHFYILVKSCGKKI